MPISLQASTPPPATGVWCSERLNTTGATVVVAMHSQAYLNWLRYNRSGNSVVLGKCRSPQPG